MSNEPLFQNTDAQEAAYAPEQLSSSETTGRETEYATSERSTDEPEDGGLATAGYGLSAGNTGGGLGASNSTPTVGAAPAVGASAIVEELRDEDEPAPRD